MLSIEPPQSSGWQIAGKTAIWLLTGIMLSFLIFIIISLLGTEFFQDGEGVFMAMIFMLVACIVTLIGTGMISWILNIVFWSDYYDFGKMFWFSILTNGLLLVLFAPVYLSLSGDIHILLLILAFHIIFWFFVSYSLIEFTTNPNYAWSSLIGTLIGFAITMMIYLLMYKSTLWWDPGEKIYYLMLLPLIIGYTIIPLSHGIWSGIYAGIVGWWSNPLYIPSSNEITKTQEIDDINVQL